MAAGIVGRSFFGVQDSDGQTGSFGPAASVKVPVLAFSRYGGGDFVNNAASTMAAAMYGVMGVSTSRTVCA